ncbi:MAG: hypothetical protein JWP31_1730 [Aeromicrobium sp.]|nr:hypothetical protein [Aeromicrobium sp.]
MRRATPVIAIVLLSVLGACGGSDGSTSDDGGSSGGTTSDTKSSHDTGTKPAATDFDPCTDITTAEVAEILGYDVVQTELPAGGCSWGNEEDPRRASFSVTDGMPR